MTENGQRPRSARSALRRATEVLAAVLSVAFAVAFAVANLASPRVLFVRPERALARASANLRTAVLSRGGIVALWTFDDPDPAAWTPSPGEPGTNPPPVAAPGTASVPGRFGSARRFYGDEDCWMRQEREWRSMPAGFSVTLWVRLRRFPVRQDIFATADAGQWGFRLDSGRIAFDATLSNGVVTVSAPFGRFREWTHLAAVSNPDTGTLSLWMDGEPAATIPAPGVAPRAWPFAFGSASCFKTRFPLCGDVDDAAVWSRPLRPDEIRRIARSGKSIAELFSSRRERCRVASARAHRDAFAALARLAVSCPVLRRISAEDRPETVSLVLGKAAARHLARAHARSRKSGCLVSSARPVEGFFTQEGRTVRCLVSLHGSSSFYADSRRMSFSIVAAEPGAPLPGGTRRLVLAPPEGSGWAFPLAASILAEETGLPLAPACHTASVRLNGRSLGVYLARDFSLAGASPFSAAIFRAHRSRGKGQSSHVTISARRLAAPESLSPAVAAAAAAFLGPERAARAEARLRDRFAAVLSDTRSPVHPSLVRAALEKASSALRRAGADSPAAAVVPLREELLLGANSSAFRVCDDLDFARFSRNLAPGLSAEFRSLDPAFLSDSGRVLTRPDSEPCEVGAEAVVRDASGGEATFRLRFRIMPRTFGVPAVFLWCGSEADKIRRTDAAVAFFSAGEVRSEPDLILSATGPSGGGIRWRGNTSYKLHRKKLFGFKTDFPHGLFGSGPTCAAAMLNGFTDRVFLGNRAAFGLFRAMPQPEGRPTNVASRVVLAETFVNGVYYGLGEFAERIDWDLPGLAPGDVIFRHARVSPYAPAISAARPKPREGDFDEPLRAAEALFAEPSVAPDWAARAESVVDADNLADFELLTALMENLNGLGTALLFDEIPVWRPSDGKFRFVPWDFDGALRGRPEWVSFTVDDAFLERDPAHRIRLARRWRDLRAGPWSDEALGAFVDSLFLEAAPAMVSDYVAWEDVSPAEASGLAAARFAEKRAVLLARAAMIDKRLSPFLPGGEQDTE